MPRPQIKKKSAQALAAPVATTVLLTDVRELIVQARESVAPAVDSGLVTLYWHVGRRIRQDILKEKRAEYGAGIVVSLSRQLGWTHFTMRIPLEGDFHTETRVDLS